jgi:hypothetical protein
MTLDREAVSLDVRMVGHSDTRDRGCSPAMYPGPNRSAYTMPDGTILVSLRCIESAVLWCKEHHTHTNVTTHTLTLQLTYALPHTHSHFHSLTRTLSLTFSLTRIHTHTLNLAHTHTHTLTHAHSLLMNTVGSAEGRSILHGDGSD